MSSIRVSRICPLCHVSAVGATCPVCRTAIGNQATPSSKMLAAMRNARSNHPRVERTRSTMMPATVFQASGDVEGVVIKELPSAEWRRREPWSVVAGLLFIIVALPLIATVGLFAIALMILLSFLGMRFLGSGMIWSALMMPLMLLRPGQRSPRQARQFIVRTAEGNRRVAQIGIWNSYLYEGCSVRLRGTEHQGLLVVESGEDLDNRSAALVRQDRPWPWRTIAAVLAVIAFFEYASLFAGTGY